MITQERSQEETASDMDTTQDSELLIEEKSFEELKFSIFQNNFTMGGAKIGRQPKTNFFYVRQPPGRMLYTIGSPIYDVQGLRQLSKIIYDLPFGWLHYAVEVDSMYKTASLCAMTMSKSPGGRMIIPPLLNLEPKWGICSARGQSTDPLSAVSKFWGSSALEGHGWPWGRQLYMSEMLGRNINERSVRKYGITLYETDTRCFKTWESLSVAEVMRMPWFKRENNE